MSESLMRRTTSTTLTQEHTTDTHNLMNNRLINFLVYSELSQWQWYIMIDPLHQEKQIA